jgi:uncharacterized membrane protein YoaK (UPF0700 family)
MSNSAPLIERRQTRVAICVALVAGYLDAYALLKLGIYVSFMSGNTTMAGLRMGEGHLISALAPALAIPSFVSGSFAGTWITSSRRNYAHRLVFLLNAVLLCFVLVLAGHESLNITNVVVLSFAMGLLNPALSRIGSESVSLTFVTGTLSRLGSHLALAARGAPLPAAEGAWDSHFRRACLDLYLWTGFLVGAITSGILMAHAGGFVLPIAIVIMGGLGMFTRATVANGAQSERGGKRP